MPSTIAPPKAHQFTLGMPTGFQSHLTVYSPCARFGVEYQARAVLSLSTGAATVQTSAPVAQLRELAAAFSSVADELEGQRP